MACAFPAFFVVEAVKPSDIFDVLVLKYNPATYHKDQFTDIVKSLVKLAIARLFDMYFQETDVIVRHGKTSKTVLANADYEVCKLTLVALPTAIGVAEKAPANGLVIGTVFEDQHKKKAIVYLTSKVDLPRSADQPQSSFIVPYWCVQGHADPAFVNMEKSFAPVDISIGDSTFKIQVPILTNTMALVKGTELMQKLGSKPTELPSEPPCKVLLSMPMPKKGSTGTIFGAAPATAKPKAKGKAKASAKQTKEEPAKKRQKKKKE